MAEALKKILLRNWRQIFLDFFVLKLVHPNKNLKRLVVKAVFPKLFGSGSSVEDMHKQRHPPASKRLQTVKKDGLALRVAPEAVKGDEEVVLAAVKKDPRALELASERFRGDRSCVLELVRATQAAFLTAWAAEELRSDDAFVAQCRAAVPNGMLWTWYGSSIAFDAMRRRFPTAGASIPGGEAYDHVMGELKRATHGSASESASGHVRQESTPNRTTMPNAVMI